jgi:hypothetical protein
MQAQALRAPAAPAPRAPAAPRSRVPTAGAVQAPEVGWRERLGVFAVAYLVYAGIGLYTLLHLKIVEEDAEARLAHAFFAIWNQPAKLAAVGTYWPPLETLALLPFALVRPLATSLVALPLSSALFGALLLVVLDGALARGGLAPRWRWPIVAVFGLNPVVLFYAVNGMSESLYLFLLAWSVAAFVRWLQDGRWSHLAVCGMVLALGVLARYEVGAWLIPMLAATVAALAIRRSGRDRHEAAVLVLVAPVAYVLAVWTFLNWVVFGDALGYLSGTLGNVTGTSEALTHVAGGAAATAGGAGPAVAGGGRPIGALLHQALDAVWLPTLLFLPTFPVAAALLIAGLRRRRVEALFLVAALLMGAATTVAVVVLGNPATALHLRYNIRAMPIVLIAVGWAVATLSPRGRRWAAAALLVAMIAAIPVTALKMWHYDQAKGEHVFVAGLLSGDSQNGVDQPRGTGINLREQRDMARFVRRAVPGRDTLLTDDGQTFGVMLLDGHPERYLDRIDIGDERWAAVRARPRRFGVRWFLVQRRQGGVAIDQDLILDAYPQLSIDGGGLPWARLAHANGSYALYRLVG